MADTTAKTLKEQIKSLIENITDIALTIALGTDDEENDKKKTENADNHETEKD